MTPGVGQNDRPQDQGIEAAAILIVVASFSGCSVRADHVEQSTRIRELRRGLR